MKRKTDFGWTSYKATGWAKSGKKQYIGFLQDIETSQYISILFFASQPILALRTICNQINSGIPAWKIAETEIN